MNSSQRDPKWSVDESGQMHFCLLLAKIRRRHFAYLRHFVVLQLWPSKNALLVESGHLQIQHKKKQLVESGHPPFDYFKAQNAFSNGSAGL